MKARLIIFFLTLSAFCAAQTEQKAEKKEVSGILLFKFVPDPKNESFFCPLKTKIIIDSKAYDFIPRNEANYTIIRENKKFESALGNADDYMTDDYLAHLCIRNRNDQHLANCNCDSVLEVFGQTSIFDSLMYHPRIDDVMILSIQSNSIYSLKNCDTLFIAFDFRGAVVQYDNVLYGEQQDSRITQHESDSINIDDLHSMCCFEKYELTIVVLNRVMKLDVIDNKQRRQLHLQRTNRKEINIFLYE